MNKFNPKIMSYRDVLRNPINIPSFQRNYQWSTELCSELLEDLFDEFTAFKNTHMDFGKYKLELEKDLISNMFYLGQLVIMEDEQKMKIVDGQQRLTTLQLINRAIYDCVLFHETSANIQPSFYNAMELKSALQVQNQDSDVVKFIFDQSLKERVLDKKVSLTEQLNNLKTNDKELHGTFSKKPHVKNFINIYETLLSKNISVSDYQLFNYFILHRTNFLYVKIKGWNDSIKFFEIMNSKSKPLTPSDLIKNYFISQTGKQHSEFKNQWDRMIGNMSGDSDKMSKFMRYIYINQHGNTSIGKLFDNVKNKYNNAKKEPIDNFLKHMNTYEEPFLITTESADSSSMSIDALINFILTVGAKESLIPIIMEILRLSDEERKIMLLQELSAFSYMYFYSSGFKANNYSTKVTSICKKIRLNNNIDALKELFDVYKEQCVEFKRKYTKYKQGDIDYPSSSTRKSREIAKATFPLMLAKMCDIHDQQEIKKNLVFKFMDMEHIFPCNNSKWGFEVDKKHLWSIGNLLPLSSKKNRTSKNIDFKTKHDYYMGKCNVKGKEIEDGKVSVMFEELFVKLMPKINNESLWNEKAISERALKIYNYVESNDLFSIDLVTKKYLTKP